MNNIAIKNPEINIINNIKSLKEFGLNETQSEGIIKTILDIINQNISQNKIEEKIEKILAEKEIKKVIKSNIIEEFKEVEKDLLKQREFIEFKSALKDDFSKLGTNILNIENDTKLIKKDIKVLKIELIAEIKDIRKDMIILEDKLLIKLGSIAIACTTIGIAILGFLIKG